MNYTKDGDMKKVDEGVIVIDFNPKALTVENTSNIILKNSWK